MASLSSLSISRSWFVSSLLLFCLVCAPLAQAIAQTNADTLQKELGRAKSFKERFQVMNELAVAYLVQGQADSISAITGRMLLMAQQARNDTALMLAYNRMGQAAHNADMKAGLEYKFKALRIAEQLGDKASIVSLCNDISGVYEDLKDYPEALKYLRRARQYMLKTGDKTPWAPTFINFHLGYTFLGLGKIDSALHFTQLANTANLSLKVDFMQGSILYLFGCVYDSLGEDALAESFFRKSIDFSISHSLAEPLGFSTLHYSRFLIKRKRYPEARDNAMQSLAVAQRTQYGIVALEASESLREVYEALGRTDSAYRYSRLKDYYREQAISTQKLGQMQNMAFAERIRQAEEEARRLQAEEERKHNIQYAGIAIGVLVLAILFLLLSRTVVVKARTIEFLGVVVLLVFFEFINLILHPFLGRITHHSPLLMLLAMVCLAALLVPAHHRLEKWLTHRMVEKNRQVRLDAARKALAEMEKEG